MYGVSLASAYSASLSMRPRTSTTTYSQLEV